MSFTFGKRYLVILILTYILSTYFALSFPQLMPHNSLISYVYSIAFIVFLVVIVCLLCIRKSLRNISIFTFFMIIIFISGLIRTSYFTASLTSKQKLVSDNPSVCGVVKSPAVLSSTQKSYAVTLDIYSVNEISSKTIPIKLYIPTDLGEPQVGDIISCKLSLNLVSPPAFKEGFNYQNYLFQNGVVSAYYAKKAEISGTKPLNPLFALGYKIRNIITHSVDRYSYKSDNAELLKGILVGDVSGFSDELYNKYTNSGFIHIASVSGMHTSYILMLIAFMLSLIKFPNRFKSIIAIPVLVIFASVSLFTPSVLRAVIMTSVLLLSSLFRRHNDSITALFISAFILVFYNPYTLTSTGFLLSYSATLGILVYFNLIRNCISTVISSKNYFVRYFVKSVSLSTSANIGILYFGAKFFGKLQIGSIVGNIIIIPFVGLVFFCGYINCLLSYIWNDAAAVFANVIINSVLSVINYVAEFFSQGIFHLNILSPPDSFFIIYLIICAALYMLLDDN